jgi:hypothetical protein
LNHFAVSETDGVSPSLKPPVFVHVAVGDDLNGVSPRLRGVERYRRSVSVETILVGGVLGQHACRSSRRIGRRTPVSDIAGCEEENCETETE